MCMRVNGWSVIPIIIFKAPICGFMLAGLKIDPYSIDASDWSESPDIPIHQRGNNGLPQ